MVELVSSVVTYANSVGTSRSYGPVPRDSKASGPVVAERDACVEHLASV